MAYCQAHVAIAVAVGCPGVQFLHVYSMRAHQAESAAGALYNSPLGLLALRPKEIWSGDVPDIPSPCRLLCASYPAEALYRKMAVLCNMVNHYRLECVCNTCQLLLFSSDCMALLKGCATPLLMLEALQMRPPLDQAPV